MLSVSLVMQNVFMLNAFMMIVVDCRGSIKSRMVFVKIDGATLFARNDIFSLQSQSLTDSINLIVNIPIIVGFVRYPRQGSLAEGKGSVHLTSLC
jgi:hypothetical protein